MQDLYTAQVQQAVTDKDGSKLASLFAVGADSRTYLTLRQALQEGPTLRESTYTNLARSFFPDYRPFADLLAAHLLFVRDADIFTDDAARSLHAYQLAEDAFKAADKVFAQGETGWFVPTLRKLTKTLVSLALKAGKAAGDPNLSKAGEAATLLRRPMALAGGDRSPSPCKRDAIFFLANQTFRVYLALRNLRLCDTILNNTQAALSYLESFPKADRCAFHYNRGRLYLYQRRIPQARQDLLKALELCHVEHYHNTRLIMIYLIAASLPFGHFPTDDVLQAYDLSDQYGDLLPALRCGDYTGVLVALDEWQDWHRSKGNYLLLREKLEVICWRNLARRTLFVTTDGEPNGASGPPTLALQALLTAAKVSFQDETLDVDDMESMCASLADQGYLKAYLMHSKRLLVLQRGPMVGFPPVAQVHPL